MSYDVSLSFLAIVPTRDGIANPSRRMPDKHTRLFCGKTLDEWTMIQLWSSQYLGKAVFVCETEAHKERLQALADTYNIELMVRSPELLHKINDSGSLITFEAFERAMAKYRYSLVTTPFVISPCRPPGFFDWMVEVYQKKMPEMDWTFGAQTILGGYQDDMSIWHIGEDKVADHYGPPFLATTPEYLYSRSQHWISATAWHMAQMMKWFARADKDAGNYHPYMFEISKWMDIHIDDEEDWDEAEYWFKKKILIAGDNPYIAYQKKWEEK